MERHNGIEFDQEGAFVYYDDAQRALDAERANRLAMEECVDRDVKAIKDLKAQLATLQAQLESANVLIYKKNCALGRADTTITELQAQLRQVEGERDHAKKMEAVQKEVADNQTWHVQKLKDWRDTVTLALQRPGGARFEDVPEHIKALVKEHATLRQLVEALPNIIDSVGRNLNSRCENGCGTAAREMLRATLAAQDAGKGGGE